MAASESTRVNPFLIACSHGNLEEAKLNSDHLWDTHEFDLCSGAIHYATASGNLDLVKWLIFKGGKEMIRIRNSAGWTMLHSSLFKGNDEMVKWMLDRYEDNSFEFEPKDEYEVEEEVEEGEEDDGGDWEYGAEYDGGYDTGENDVTIESIYDVEAFFLAAKAKMWWVMRHIWNRSIRDAVQGLTSNMSRLLWSCRYCLDDLLGALSCLHMENNGCTFLNALTRLKDVHKNDLDVRSMFKSLVKFGMIQSYVDNDVLATTVLLCANLDVTDLLVGYWFGDLVRVSNQAPQEGTVTVWINRLFAMCGKQTRRSTIPQATKHYLDLLSRGMFDNCLADTDLATVLLSATFHTAPECSPREILEYVALRAEDPSMVSMVGFSLIVEMKRLSQQPLARHINFRPQAGMDRRHHVNLLDQLTQSQEPWPLFRIIMGHDVKYGISDGNAMLWSGALWTMRSRRRASILDILTNMHRGLIQGSTHAMSTASMPLKMRILCNMWMVWFMSCMDEKGYMFTKLPLRPHLHIYSMLFAVPGYYDE